MTHDNECDFFGEDGPESPDDSWELLDRLLGPEGPRILYVWGEPGIGKTYSAYHTGRVQNGVYSLTLTEETPSSELRGHYIVGEDGSMRWEDGPVTRALREGGRLVLNEVSHASPDSLTYLHPILEGEGTARLTLPNNETVRPAPGFHCVLTDNLPPWDLPPALADRMECQVHVKSPPPGVLKLLDPDLAWAARRTCGLGNERRISLRAFFSLQRLRPILGTRRALTAVFGRERGLRLYQELCLSGRLKDIEGAA